MLIPSNAALPAPCLHPNYLAPANAFQLATRRLAGLLARKDADTFKCSFACTLSAAEVLGFYKCFFSWPLTGWLARARPGLATHRLGFHACLFSAAKGPLFPALLDWVLSCFKHAEAGHL